MILLALEVGGWGLVMMIVVNYINFMAIKKLHILDW